MATRAAAGFVLLVIMFAVIFFAPLWALPIAVSIIAVLAVHEMLNTTGFVRHKRLLAYALTLSALIPLWVFFRSISELAIAAIFIFVFLLFIECLTGSREINFEKISGVFFASTVIPLFLSSIVRIYMQDHGRFLVLLPLLSAFASDVFALLVGKRFGKNPGNSRYIAYYCLFTLHYFPRYISNNLLTDKSP
jgi:phosphatidate cytidylyltransferase